MDCGIVSFFGVEGSVFFLLEFLARIPLFLPTVCNRRAEFAAITVCSFRIPAWSSLCKRAAFDHARAGIAECVGMVEPGGDLARVTLVVVVVVVVVRVAAVCD